MWTSHRDFHGRSHWPLGGIKGRLHAQWYAINNRACVKGSNMFGKQAACDGAYFCNCRVCVNDCPPVSPKGLIYNSITLPENKFVREACRA